MSQKENLVVPEDVKSSPLEDRALKGVAQLFGEELMPLLGIKEKVKRIAPTEQVYLNPQDFMEDFNYEMGEGSWTHLEFESDSIKTKDLRRFRSYEAVTSYRYGVDVTTCVLCSAKAKRLKSSLKTGINTYHVKILRMKDKDADQMIGQLEEQQKKKGKLSRPELLQILLMPLINGSSSQQSRIQRGFKLLREQREHLESEELMEMEAVLYTFSIKFLEEEQLKKIREMMHMTILGEMILQDGIEVGRKEGIKEGENSVNRLHEILLEAGRLEDLKRAVKDYDFQKKLMKELLIENDKYQKRSSI